MSNEKEQTPNSPSQETLPGLKRAAETMSSNSNNDDFILPMSKKMKFDELQTQAYYNVLHAFRLREESPEISSSRVLVIQELMKEWNIAQETQNVNQLREDSSESDENEDSLNIQEMLNTDPAKIQEENTKPSSTSEDSSPFPGWGQVSPESLIDKWINIRMPGEEQYIAFLIIEYDTEKEAHRLVTALSKKELNDPCDWVDLRHIPAEDIIWQVGFTGLPTRERFLKPGQTLLYETTTGGKKKQLNQVGETASGS